MQKRRSGGGAHGYKEKVVLIHLLVDADLMPMLAYSARTNKDKMKHVGNLIDTVAAKTGNAAQEHEKSGGR